jgi:hypothetical protein
MIRMVVTLLVALAACAPSTPFRGGKSGGGSSSGAVYRTTATGEPVSGHGGGGLGELATAGLITLGISYGVTVITGQVVALVAFDDFDRMIGAEGTVSRLWLPVIGPPLAIVHNETVVRGGCRGPKCEDMVTGTSLAIAVGGLAQTTGLVLTIIGLMRSDGGGGPDKLAIVPFGGGDAAGVAIGGGF